MNLPNHWFVISWAAESQIVGVLALAMCDLCKAVDLWFNIIAMVLSSPYICHTIIFMLTTEWGKTGVNRVAMILSSTTLPAALRRQHILSMRTLENCFHQNHIWRALLQECVHPPSRTCTGVMLGSNGTTGAWKTICLHEGLLVSG